MQEFLVIPMDQWFDLDFLHGLWLVLCHLCHALQLLEFVAQLFLLLLGRLLPQVLCQQRSHRQLFMLGRYHQLWTMILCCLSFKYDILYVIVNLLVFFYIACWVQLLMFYSLMFISIKSDFWLFLKLCGPVKSWKRPQDPTGTLKGFGFCEFESAEGVLCALRLLNKLSVDGQELMVWMHCPLLLCMHLTQLFMPILLLPYYVIVEIAFTFLSQDYMPQNFI